MQQPEQLTIDEALSRAKKAARKGNVSVAVHFYNAVLQSQPDHPVAKKGLRKLQRQMRGRSRTQAAPEPPQDKVNALIRLCDSGQMQLAEQACGELLETYPKSLLVLNVLGIALQRQGMSEEAVATLERAIQLQPDVVETYVNRGTALKELDRVADAILSYDEAIKRKPDYSEAHFNRANALKDCGRLQEAMASYDRAIEIEPGFTAAHQGLSTIKTYAPGDEQIASMEKLIADTEIDDSGRIALCFALAKAYDDLDEFDKCFRYLEDGNRLRKKQLAYDIHDDKRLFTRIKGLFTPAVPAAAVSANDGAFKQPLFIVGMMRSGTSLVEQILASHSEVHGAGELETMNQLVASFLSASPELMLTDAGVAAIRHGYLDALGSLNVSQKIITDKMPLNFRWIGFILSAIPEAKIVHVTRDPIATCWSMYKHYFPAEGTGFTCDMDDLVEFNALYTDLMSIWRERYADRIYELNYEDLTRNQEHETRKLLAFCDLEWQRRCLDFHETERTVKTLSTAQVRQKIYTGSSEAWREYQQHLQPLIEGLGNPGPSSG